MIEKTGSYTYIQEILENLQGNYEAETIASMAVSLDVKKELEAKLYPNFAERWIWMSVKTSAEIIVFVSGITRKGGGAEGLPLPEFLLKSNNICI